MLEVGRYRGTEEGDACFIVVTMPEESLFLVQSPVKSRSDQVFNTYQPRWVGRCIVD
jgi:hypothetical protein